MSISSSKLASIHFAKSHEWVKVDAGIGTVGLSEHATEALGDVVFAELPAPETEVTGGGECGVVESVKAASDLMSPVSGIVTEKNDKVEDEPGLINKSCMADGWLFKLKLSDESELDSLMNEADYKNYLKGLSDE